MWSVSPGISPRPVEILEVIQGENHGFLLWDDREMKYNMLSCPRCRFYVFVSGGFSLHSTYGKDTCKVHGDLEPDNGNQDCPDFKGKKK